MPARLKGVVQGLLLALSIGAGVSGCASQPADGPARTPDETILAPAQQALTKALDAQADQFAPEPVDAARRRLTIARDVLFAAARQGRPVTADERDRVQQLVDEATLDARAALVETQADAVDSQLARLQSNSSGSDNAVGGGPVAGPAATGAATDDSSNAGNDLMNVAPIGSQDDNDSDGSVQ